MIDDLGVNPRALLLIILDYGIDVVFAGEARPHDEFKLAKHQKLVNI